MFNTLINTLAGKNEKSTYERKTRKHYRPGMDRLEARLTLSTLGGPSDAISISTPTTGSPTYTQVSQP